MSNTAHEGTDDMSDYAAANPWLKRHEAHRALPIAEDWPARRAFIPQGCEQQRRYVATIQPQPAECCTEVGADEDQSDSADGEVIYALLKFSGFLLLVGVFVGVYVGAADPLIAQILEAING